MTLVRAFDLTPRIGGRSGRFRFLLFDLGCTQANPAFSTKLIPRSHYFQLFDFN